MLRKLVGLFAATALLGGIAVSYACHRPCGEKRVEHLVKEMSARLALDDSQRKHLDRIKNELIEKGKTLRESHASMRAEVMEQLRGEKIDEQKLNDLYQRKRGQVDDMVALVITRLAEFHRTLTPEQRDKLMQELDKMEQCRRLFFAPGD